MAPMADGATWDSLGRYALRLAAAAAVGFLIARAYRASTRAADARTAADALVRTHLTDGPYESHWQRVWARADAAATPSARPFSELNGLEGVQHVELGEA